MKRIRALEDIGNSFPGVEETFALQAGREVRVVVRPDNIDDLKKTSPNFLQAVTLIMNLCRMRLR